MKGKRARRVLQKMNSQKTGGELGFCRSGAWQARSKTNALGGSRKVGLNNALASKFLSECGNTDQTGTQ
jgi:hypothetical protein